MPANSRSEHEAGGSSQSERGPADTLVSDASLQNCERINLSFSHSACAVPLRQPEETNTTA